MSQETCQHLEVVSRRDWRAMATIHTCSGCSKELVIYDRELVNVHPDHLQAFVEARIVQAFGAMWAGQFAALHEHEQARRLQQIAPEYSSLDLIHAVAGTDPEGARAMLKDHMRRFHPDHPMLHDE